MPRTLLDHLAADARRADQLRSVVATVTAVGTNTVDLSVNGGTVPGVPVADSYAAPTVGDVVLVVKLHSAWLAFTRLGTNAATPAAVLTAHGPVVLGTDGQTLTAAPSAPAGVSWTDRPRFHEQRWTLTVDGPHARRLDKVVVPESEHVYLNGFLQTEGVDWSRTDTTLSVLAGMDARAGDELSIRYAYTADAPLALNIPFRSDGWLAKTATATANLTDWVAPDYDDSAWTSAACPIGWGDFTDTHGDPVATVMPSGHVPLLGHEFDGVVRRLIAPGTGIVLGISETNYFTAYVDGVEVAAYSTGNPVEVTVPIPDQTEPWLLAVVLTVANGYTAGGVDLEVTGTPL